jgi:hypothetical protein
LTVDKSKILSYSRIHETSFLEVVLTLSDTKIKRARTVYDLVTLVAEVSGFADLFVLGLGALIGSFVNPKAIESEQLNHLDFKINKKKCSKV